MICMNIAIIYFSATGNTAKVASAISETLKRYEAENWEAWEESRESDKSLRDEKQGEFWRGFKR